MRNSDLVRRTIIEPKLAARVVDLGRGDSVHGIAVRARSRPQRTPDAEVAGQQAGIEVLHEGLEKGDAGGEDAEIDVHEGHEHAV